MVYQYGLFLNDIPGPEIWVEIGVPGFPSKRVPVRAMIDTGACQTILPSSVSRELKAFGNRPAYRYRDVTTIDGLSRQVEIDVDLYVDDVLVKDRCPVLVPKKSDLDFALIGRDVLNPSTLVLMGPCEKNPQGTWTVLPPWGQTAVIRYR